MPSATGNIFERHDHRRCTIGGMSEAREHCRRAGLRLTAVRARVLEILLESHRALGAYDILDRLAAEGLGSQPPVVYRALEFLAAQGFVHRLERLNAFTACAGPQQCHEAAFLICQTCRKVAETPLTGIVAGIDQQAASLGFEVRSRVVEITGLCTTCRDRDAA